MIGILIRGDIKIVCEEVIQSIYDVICVVRNVIRDNKVVTGGGPIEIAFLLEMENASMFNEGRRNRLI